MNWGPAVFFTYSFFWGVGMHPCVLAPQTCFILLILVFVCFLDLGLCCNQGEMWALTFISDTDLYFRHWHVLGSALVQASGSIRLILNEPRPWCDNPTIPSETKNVFFLLCIWNYWFYLLAIYRYSLASINSMKLKTKIIHNTY